MMDFVMVIHCHQPVGNFDNVFDLAHKKCYRPLLELLSAHPAVPFRAFAGVAGAEPEREPGPPIRSGRKRTG